MQKDILDHFEVYTPLKRLETIRLIVGTI